MNILYDAEGYEYPIDKYGQIYVPLETEQTAAKVIEEEKIRETKHLKRSYASMSTAGATVCSTSIGSQKMIKNWREAVKHFHRVDRARFLRRDGSVITCDWEALRQEMDTVDVG